jgi:hypothetical protein
MIRKATAKDLQAIIEMGYRLCDRTPQKHVKRDRPSIAKQLTVCMSSAFGCCFVAEHEGALTGAIVGIAQQYWFSNQRQAVDLMFVSERAGDGPRLLRAFIDWAWKVPGVVEVAGAQSSGIEIERTAEMYERLGFQRVGSVFSMTQRPHKAQARVA